MQKLARRAEYEMYSSSLAPGAGANGRQNHYWKNYRTDLAEIWNMSYNAQVSPSRQIWDEYITIGARRWRQKRQNTIYHQLKCWTLIEIE